MPSVSEKFSKTKPSPIVVINNKAKALQKEGREILNFSIGVPNFLPPKHVYDAAHKAVDEDTGQYLAPFGSDSLLTAFQGLLAKQNFHYEQSQLCATMGAKNALVSLCQVLMNEGDELLFPAPYWSSYIQTAEIAGGIPVAIPCGSEQNYKLKPEQLEAAITPKTKIFLFNNPSNPTGMVYTKAEIKALADVLNRHDIWIISDDLYDKMIFDGEQFHHLLTAEPKLKDRAIIVQSVSKNYGMPGWRVGLVAAPENIAKMVRSMAGNTVMNIPAVTQAAATAAIAGDQSFIAERCAEFQEKRDIVMAALNGINGVVCPHPQGAFYAFPNISAFYGKSYNGEILKDDVHLCELLLEHAGIALVPGSAFGDAKAIRLSYATSIENINSGLGKLKEFLEALV